MEAPLSEATRPSKEKVADDFRALVSDAEELLRTTADYSGERLAEVRARFSEKLEEWKAVMAETQDAARANGKRYATAADDYVRTNPWQAVGMGMIVGIVIGLWSRRG
jgi:ElaB/YqjD/DUF883 family membrane-anchored ribosome-binding protein